MGKAGRNKRERRSAISETHEPYVPTDWPEGHARVELTGSGLDECILVTIHGVRHYLHSTTAHALNEALRERIMEWDSFAKSEGAPGVLGPAPNEGERDGTQLFDASAIAAEIEHARAASKEMIRGALGVLGTARGFTINHVPFLAFVERAQAFHQGVVDMVERGNPLAAATLLRSFAENLAVVFYVEKHPAEFEKLRPGAEHGFPMGKVVAAAQQSLPGFKGLYDHLSSMAHPSGAGAYQTFQLQDDGAFTWQSTPTFRSDEDARIVLVWLGEIRELSARVITNTAVAFREFDAGDGDS